MILALLRPRRLAVRNRLRRIVSSGESLSPQIIGLLFSAVVAVMLFNGTNTLLQLQHTSALSEYIHPSHIYAALFFGIFALVFLSGLGATLGAFFLAQDTELLLSCPLQKGYLFLGKLIDSLIGSTWLLTVFLTPIYLALLWNTELSLAVHLAALCSLAMLVLSAHSLAAVAVFIFVYLVSPRTLYRVLLVLGALILVFIVYLSQGVDFSTDDGLRAVLGFLYGASVFTPWSTAASLMSGGLSASSAIYSILFQSPSLLLPMAVGFVLFRGISAERMLNFHELGPVAGRRIFTRQAFVRRWLEPVLPSQWSGLLLKDYRLFARDIGQAVQLLLLIGLCFMYLYKFKVLGALEARSPEHLLWWQTLLVLVNLTMSSFVVIALCCRFVYPSVSMEGKAFWIIASSPVSLRTYLIEKCLFWGVPLACISAVITFSGALAINAPPNIIFTSTFCSAIITLGLTALAVGFGAFFVQLDWNNPIELTTSIGSVLFMFVAVIVLTLSLVPLTSLLLLRTLLLSGVEFSGFEWYGAVATSGLLFVYFLYGSARKALQVGENGACRKLFA